ncbi:MAG: PIG-L family deacetylase [Elusimicrobia bacterium]|nr:PIG-L family deacetylase [Elusimicrobiota bacterium]
MVPVSLFMFAHQDDEYGVFPYLERKNFDGKCIIVYLTDGGKGRISPSQRNNESMRVLNSFGIAPENIWFIGEALGVKDGTLCNYLERVWASLRDRLHKNRCEVRVLYAPAWEGGHPDHDGVNVLARRLVKFNSDTTMAWQFSLYHGKGCIGPFYHVMSPLEEDGPCSQKTFSWKEGIRYACLCFSYHSQWRTWVGLWPFVAARYLLFRKLCLQPLSIRQGRPHNGILYYEKRDFARYEDVSRCVNAFFNFIK